MRRDGALVGTLMLGFPGKARRQGSSLGHSRHFSATTTHYDTMTGDGVVRKPMAVATRYVNKAKVNSVLVP